MLVAMKSVRHHSENWAMGGTAFSTLLSPPASARGSSRLFRQRAGREVPSIEIKLHSLQSGEDTSEVLSGKYHACILPRESRPDRKPDVRPSSGSASCSAVLQITLGGVRSRSW